MMGEIHLETHLHTCIPKLHLHLKCFLIHVKTENNLGKYIFNKITVHINVDFPTTYLTILKYDNM